MFSLAESFKRKQYEAGRAEGRRIAYEEKRAKFNAELQAWQERQQDAQSKGLPFDEPPPVFDGKEPPAEFVYIPPPGPTIWLSESFLRKRYEAGLEVGRAEGRAKARREIDAIWEAWLARRDAALSRGEPFDEPPPSLKNNPGPRHS